MLPSLPSLALASLPSLASLASASLTPITAVGNKLFAGDAQFFIKGVAYQLRPHDPLIDTEQCRRDAALMKKLGANTIRVYHVDPAQDHDGCMAALEEAGIYTLVDLDTFHTYILPDSPWWNATQLARYTAVLDAFHGYDNLLGVFVGNEIIAKEDQSGAAPFIKAAARDVKAHRDARGYRPIPVGYSATDIAELRPMLQDYLTCGGNASENVDFYGLNSYQWCDPSSYSVSGYANLQAQAKDFPVPIFFSETGCNKPGPRLFDDQDAIFGPDMAADWSGAIVYEWIQEANDYGLVSYGPPADPTATGPDVEGGFTVRGTPTPVTPDFANLSRHWAKATPTGVRKDDYDARAVSTRDCPASTAGGWLVDGDVALPTLGATLSASRGDQPTATGGGGEATESAQSSASGTQEVAGMAAGLVGVMVVFALWM